MTHVAVTHVCFPFRFETIACYVTVILQLVELVILHPDVHKIELHVCSSKPSRYFNQTLSSPRNQGSLENTSAERRALEEYVIWICDLTVGGQVVGSNCWLYVGYYYY